MAGFSITRDSSVPRCQGWPGVSSPKGRPRAARGIPGRKSRTSGVAFHRIAMLPPSGHNVHAAPPLARRLAGLTTSAGALSLPRRFDSELIRTSTSSRPASTMFSEGDGRAVAFDDAPLRRRRPPHPGPCRIPLLFQMRLPTIPFWTWNSPGGRPRGSNLDLPCAPRTEMPTRPAALFNIQGLQRGD